MILCIGDKYKLGGLVEVFKARCPDESIEFIEVCTDIKKQENDILHMADVHYMIFDLYQYYNEPDEIIDIIKRICRTNKAKPILLSPTDSPKNDLVKAAVAAHIKGIINEALPLGEQKDQLEKVLAGYYEANQRDDIAAVESEVQEEQKTLNEFVGELYDAKQREEEREATIVIKQKKSSEIIIDYTIKFFKAIISVISMILIAIALISLVYEQTRVPLFNILFHIYSEALTMIGLGG